MSINPSTNDIMEDIRKKLKVAQEKLNTTPEDVGDTVELSEPDAEIVESDEQYDEVILSDENPDEVRKNQERQNLDDIKSSLTADAQEEEYADEEYIEEQNEEGQTEEDYEEENAEDSNEAQEEEYAEEEYIEEQNQEDQTEEEYEEENAEDSNEAQEEEYADEEYIEDKTEEDYEEEQGNEEYQKEENYNELTEKISQILDAKLSSFTQMQYKKEDTISDLVKAELPRILKNWVQNNEELIINIVEKVVERQISEAISKIKK